MSKLAFILIFKIKNEINLIEQQIILNILNELLFVILFIDKIMIYKILTNDFLV